MRQKNVLSLLASIMMMAACGDSTSSGGGGAGAGTSSGAGTNTGGEGGTQASCDLAELNLEGLWAVKVSLPAEISGTTGGPISVCPGTQTTTIETVYLMNVAVLDPTQSARFTMCSLGLPTVGVTAAPTCTGGTLDLSYVRHDDRVRDGDLDPQPLTVSSKDPGATFSLDPVNMAFGSGPPLPSWNTTDVACEDAALGHGACEVDCVDGDCTMIDSWNDDLPGFTFGLCGITNSETLDQCDLDDPTNIEGSTIQGSVFTTFFMNNTFSGTFATSCDGTADVTNEFDFSYIGGNLYAEDVQLAVTEMVKALPSFTVTGPGTAHFVRIDGRFGSPNFDQGDVDDTCDAVLDNIDSL